MITNSLSNLSAFVITYMYVNERGCVLSLREQKESLRIWLNIWGTLQWVMFEEAIEYTSCRWNALNENGAATSKKTKYNKKEKRKENQSATTKKQARKTKYV